MIKLVLGALGLGAGGWYFWKRGQGAPAPPVAPTHPTNPPVVPANTPSNVLSAGPSPLLSAITAGNTTTMTQTQAQAAITAADQAGAFASSDLGQAAGGGQTSNTALDSALAGL
jgi:hypothetical protein